MNFENNPCLFPREKGFDLIKPLVERVGQLEKAVKGFEDEFETKDLKADDAEIGSLKVTSLEIPTLEAENSNFQNSDIENADVENLNATNIKNSKMVSEEPIPSNAVVGYDEEGNLRPIRVLVPSEDPSLFYDYVVDSQAKFDDLMAVLKSGTPNTFKRIAIKQGLGDGDNGEYLYDIDGSTGEADLNQALLEGFGLPTILISSDNADTMKVLKNGEIKGLKFDVGGTVLEEHTVTLLYGCSVKDCELSKNDTPIGYKIDACSLNNVKNNESVKFADCSLASCVHDDEETFTDCSLEDGEVKKASTFTSSTLNKVIVDEGSTYAQCQLTDCENKGYSTFGQSTLKGCETVQSVFNECSSEMLYVKVDAEINHGFTFNKCGLHLDFKKTDMTQSETMSLTIDSLVNSNIVCLDKSSKLKKFDITVTSADILSEIVGNNDNVYSNRKNIYTMFDEVPTPSTLAEAYRDIGESSGTIIYTTNPSISYNNTYLDPQRTKLIHKWNVPTANGIVIGYSLNNEYTYYTNLSFNSIINDNDSPSEIPFHYVKLEEKSEGCIINNTEVKSYFDMGESSGTTIYSKDDTSTLTTSTEFYLNVACSSDKRIHKWNVPTASGTVIGYSLGNEYVYYKNLSFNNRINDNDNDAPSEIPFTPIEIQTFKNQYDVHVSTSHMVNLRTKDLWYDKINNG